MITKRLMVIAILLLAGCNAGVTHQSKPANSNAPVVDAILIINSTTPKIRLVDENNVDVGSVTFEKETTVTIRRK